MAKDIKSLEARIAKLEADNRELSGMIADRDNADLTAEWERMAAEKKAAAPKVIQTSKAPRQRGVYTGNRASNLNFGVSRHKPGTAANIIETAIAERGLAAIVANPGSIEGVTAARVNAHLYWRHAI